MRSSVKKRDTLSEPARRDLNSVCTEHTDTVVVYFTITYNFKHVLSVTSFLKNVFNQRKLKTEC